MATAKKSARKPAAKKSKSVAARTTKKTTNKKVVSSKASVASRDKVRGPFDAIRSFLRSSVIVYAALAAAVVSFVSMASNKIYLTVQDHDVLASGADKVLAPASEVLFNLQPHHWLATMLGVSALGSLLLATKLRGGYEDSVTNKTSGWRWLYIGITAGLSLQFVALLVGIGDVATLKMSAGLIFITALCGWLAERENIASTNPKWLAFAASIVAGVLAWLPILVSLIGTSLYGAENFDWYVYAVSGVVLLGFIGFAVNKYRFIKNKSTDYMKNESNYWRIDFLYKLAVVAIVLIAL